MFFSPSRRYENALRRQGYHYIAGLDEAGKGAWAGPVVAGCVILPENTRLSGLRDSKLMTPIQRERLYVAIAKQALAWAVGVISHEVIDTIGIVRATERAMQQALSKLEMDPEYVLIDGVPFWKPRVKHEFIIKGDRHLTSIAAASVMAKVTRDRIMSQYENEHEGYGFANHKGYGTEEHYELLKVHGPCAIHRRTFHPINVYAR